MKFHFCCGTYEICVSYSDPLTKITNIRYFLMKFAFYEIFLTKCAFFLCYFDKNVHFPL